jgi:NADH-quinone oxidoreductase subunit M
MSTLHLPLLEIAVLAPLVAAPLARGANRDRARRVAMLASAIALVASVSAWFDLAAIHAFEAHDGITLLGWIPGGDPLVLDELSAPLLPLTALQFLLTIVATLRTKVARFSFGWTLVSQSFVMGLLAAKAPWLIAVLAILGAAIPIIEIRRRGGSARMYMAYLGLFAATLGCGVAIRAVASHGTALDAAGEGLIALAVLVRSAAFPFHSWLPNLFSKTSFGTSLLFSTPLVGPYLALRLLLPDGSPFWLRVVAVAALVTSVYAAGMSLVQRDARRFYAFVLLSQASMVLLGLEIVTLLGLTGALSVWLSVGLAMTGFGLTLRSIEGRVGAIDLGRYHGLHDASPMHAGFFLLNGLASIGFPGTIGFIALEVLVEGAIDWSPVIGVVVLLATALNGVAVMHAYFRVFTGIQHTGAIDLGVRPNERFAVLTLSLLMLGGGLAPSPGVDSRRHAAEALLEQRAAATTPVFLHNTPADDNAVARSSFDPRCPLPLQ